MRPTALVSALLALGAASGCGGAAASTPGTASTPSTRASAPAPARSSRSVLTADEILKTGATNAFQAIQKARPSWLNTRPTNDARGGALYEGLAVYVDGVRYEERLDQLPATSIKEIRFLDGREATTRFGTNHGGGALLILLAR